MDTPDPEDACPQCGFSVCQTDDGRGDGENLEDEGEEGTDAGRLRVGGVWFHKPCIYAERAVKREAKLLDLAHDKKGKETPHMDALTNLRKTDRKEYRRRVSHVTKSSNIHR